MPPLVTTTMKTMSEILGEDRPPWRITVRRTAERVGADSPAPEISPTRVEALRTARELEGLPEEVDGELLALARELASFRAEQLEKLPTPRDLEEQARQIRISALHLHALLASSDTGVFLGIDAELVGLIGLDDDEQIGRRMSVAADLLAALAEAAAQEAEKRGRVPSSRPPVTPRLAGFIAGLAHLLMPYGVIAAEGGRFGRLCAAVFSAGHPGGSPVGALRYFVKEWRDDYARRGLVLAPKDPPSPDPG